MIEAFLVSIIVALVIDKYLYSKDMNKQVADCMRALISRNMSEFTQAIEIEKVKPVKQEPADEIPLTQATDEQFLQAIKETL